MTKNELIINNTPVSVMNKEVKILREGADYYINGLRNDYEDNDVNAMDLYINTLSKWEHIDENRFFNYIAFIHLLLCNKYFSIQNYSKSYIHYIEACIILKIDPKYSVISIIIQPDISFNQSQETEYNKKLLKEGYCMFFLSLKENDVEVMINKHMEFKKKNIGNK